MALTEELRALIHDMAREAELARSEVREELRATEEAKSEERRAKERARFEEDMAALFSGGPAAAPCSNCELELRATHR